MPLDKSGSKASVGANIKTELSAGKPRRQAIAIALSVQRRAKGNDMDIMARRDGAPVVPHVPHAPQGPSGNIHHTRHKGLAAKNLVKAPGRPGRAFDGGNEAFPLDMNAALARPKVLALALKRRG